MDLDTRIERRARHRDDQRLVIDYGALNPVAHVDDPTNRDQLFERLLDHLDPIFDGRKPPDAAVWGPRGVGKSGVVVPLVDRLNQHVTRSQSIIHTSTRAQTIDTPAVIYLDIREIDSAFQLYRSALTALGDVDIPRQGISTETIRSRLRDRLAAENGAVVVADHVGEPRRMSGETVREHFWAFGGAVRLLVVGRSPPPGEWYQTEIEVPAHDDQVLTDLLMNRAGSALASNAFSLDQARELAAWARGNAHDALAALFGAADSAERTGHQRITAADLANGKAVVPRPSVSLGRVLALPPTRQHVLRELVALPDSALTSVNATTDAIADSRRVDLSVSTVRRFIYELADIGILERIQLEDYTGEGRPPSRVEPRFPTVVFKRLYDRDPEQ